MSKTENTGSKDGSRKVAGIILAAGKSTRMVTEMPKVLHEVCGRPMLAYVIDACRAAGIEDLYVIVGYGSEQVKENFADVENITWVHQTEQKGTGHAVMCCREYLKDFDGDVVVLCGDGPLVRSQTLEHVLGKHREERSAATLATAILPEPNGYGRIVRDAYGNLQGIVEESECTPAQKQINEVNPSYYCFDNQILFEAIDQIKPDNVKHEYYLTDALQIMIHSGKKALAITAVNPEEVFSINSRRQLADVSKVMQERIQESLLVSGVTIVDPVNTWIDARAKIGQDTVIHPFTYIHGRVSIGKHCHIGPFAYLRDGTVLDDDVVFGVFAEIKNSHLKQGARARHHTYIGDSSVGKNVNVGAGTIFANYDGSEINRTEVGDDAFIGSGAVLVAPLAVRPRTQVQPGTVVRENGSNHLGQSEDD